MSGSRDKDGTRDGDTDTKMSRPVIRGWKVLKQRLLRMDQNLLEEEFCIFLQDLPKPIKRAKPLYYHRFLEHFVFCGRDWFYIIGLKTICEFWCVSQNGRIIEDKTIILPCLLLALKHVMENKVFVGLTTEKVLLVISVIQSRPKVLCEMDQLFNAREIAIISETCQVVVGGVGFLKVYSLAGVQFKACVEPAMDIRTSMLGEECVIGLKVEPFSHTLLVLVESGVIIVDYTEWRELYRFGDPEGGTINCCCVFGHNTYLITGSRFGFVKVWSTAIKVLMHSFVGHRDCITGMACHETEPLLITSSADGWVFIWRLDTFRKFKQVNVGGTVSRLGVCKTTSYENVGFWCEVNGIVKFFEMAEPYRFFACMDSAVVKLKRLLGHDEYPNRILVATGDGGVWFKNPVTGETVGFMYPIIFLKMMEKYVYDVFRQRLYIIMPTGGVLTVSCAKSPFRALEQLPPQSPDEKIISIVDVLLCVGTDQHSFESVAIFIGLQNGQIELMESEGFYMAHPVQAHHGSVMCLETVTDVQPGEERTHSMCRIMVSSGSDMLIKLWRLQARPEEAVGFHLILIEVMQIRCDKLPRFVSASQDRIAVTFIDNNTLEVYDVGKTALHRVRPLSSRSRKACQPLHCYRHDKDYDHTQMVTALDKCPLLKIFATASLDKTVKIWNKQNLLIRELVFEEPVVDICFATDIGDLLIAREFALVFSSPEQYLPWSYLEDMLSKNYAEDEIEPPKQLKESDRSWIDPNKVQVRRRRPSYARRLSRCIQKRASLDVAMADWQQWTLTWQNVGGGQSSMVVPVKFPRRHRRSKLDILQDGDTPALVTRVGKGRRLTLHLPMGPQPSHSASRWSSRSGSTVQQSSDDVHSQPLCMDRLGEGGQLHDSPSLARADSTPSSARSRTTFKETSKPSLDIEVGMMSRVTSPLRSSSRASPPTTARYQFTPRRFSPPLLARGQRDDDGRPSPARTLAKILAAGRDYALAHGLTVPQRPRAPRVHRQHRQYASSVQSDDDTPDGEQTLDNAMARFQFLLTKPELSPVHTPGTMDTPRDLGSMGDLSMLALDSLTDEDFSPAASPQKSQRESKRPPSAYRQLWFRSFKAYRNKLGCGPLKAYARPAVDEPQCPSESSSYADSEEILWHERCMHIPQIPNSIICRRKKHRPPPPPSQQDKLVEKMMKNLQKLQDDRPPLFKKMIVPRTTDEEVPPSIPPPPPKKGKQPKKTKRRRKKTDNFVQWDTLEEFAPIRREMLPVFSTRLVPRRLSEMERLKLSEKERLAKLAAAAAAAALAEQKTTKGGKKVKSAKKSSRRASMDTDAESPRSRSLSDTLSSTDMVFHVDLLHCMGESWFPRGVPRKPVTIFKVLMELLSADLQAKDIVDIMDYLTNLIREATLPTKLKRTAAHKLLMMASHPSSQVQAACVKALPDIFPLNKHSLKVINDALKNPNQDVRYAAGTTLLRYDITTKGGLIEIMRKHQLAPPPRTLEQEITAIGLAEATMVQRIQSKGKGAMHLDFFHDLFHGTVRWGRHGSNPFLRPHRRQDSDDDEEDEDAARSPRRSVPTTDSRRQSRLRMPSLGNALQPGMPPKQRTSLRRRSSSTDRRSLTHPRLSLHFRGTARVSDAVAEWAEDEREHSAAARLASALCSDGAPFMDVFEKDIQELEDLELARSQPTKARSLLSVAFPRRSTICEGKSSSKTKPKKDKHVSIENKGEERSLGEARASLAGVDAEPLVPTHGQASRSKSKKKAAAASASQQGEKSVTIKEQGSSESLEHRPQHTGKCSPDVPGRPEETYISSQRQDTPDKPRKTSRSSLDRLERQRKTSKTPDQPGLEGQRKTSKTPDQPDLEGQRRPSKTPDKSGPSGKPAPQWSQGLAPISGSESRTSLHFISTDDEGADGALSDSSFKYEYPGGKAVESKKSKPKKKTDTKYKTRPKGARTRKRPVSSASSSSKGSKPGSATSQPQPGSAAKTDVGEAPPRGRQPPRRPLKAPGCRWVPGEPGLRVLHGTVGPSCPPPSTCPSPDPSPGHHVLPLGGRLGVTTHMQSGESRYGSLGLQWTTHVPSIPVMGIVRKLRELKRDVVQQQSLRVCLRDTGRGLTAPLPGGARPAIPASVFLAAPPRGSCEPIRPSVPCRMVLSRDRRQDALSTPVCIALHR